MTPEQKIEWGQLVAACSNPNGNVIVKTSLVLALHADKLLAESYSSLINKRLEEIQNFSNTYLGEDNV